MAEGIISYLSNVFSNELIRTIVIFILIPVFLKYYESNYLSDLAKKKSIWINFIQKNQYIQNCISKYENLENEVQLNDNPNYNTLLKSGFAVFFIALITYFAVIISYGKLIGFLSSIIKSDYLLILTIDSISQTIISITFFVVAIYLGLKSRQLFDETTTISKENIVVKHPIIQKKYNKIIIYAAVFTYFGIPFFIQNMSYIFYALAFIVSGIVTYQTYKYKQMYAQKTKNVINSEFNENFPVLEVSTIGAEKCIGMLKDVFDHETITLIDDDAEIKILWNAVATLKEQKEAFDEKQKHLDDFFKKDVNP